MVHRMLNVRVVSGKSIVQWCSEEVMVSNVLHVKVNYCIATTRFEEQLMSP